MNSLSKWAEPERETYFTLPAISSASAFPSSLSASAAPRRAASPTNVIFSLHDPSVMPMASSPCFLILLPKAPLCRRVYIPRRYAGLARVFNPPLWPTWRPETLMSVCVISTAPEGLHRGRKSSLRLLYPVGEVGIHFRPVPDPAGGLYYAGTDQSIRRLCPTRISPRGRAAYPSRITLSLSIPTLNRAALPSSATYLRLQTRSRRGARGVRSRPTPHYLAVRADIHGKHRPSS